ncbi:hypothetical protein BKA62DRAFT_233422 [Auriculariales sp. MPI-PUGE-AT-0066]|nr:hypothetical protein BKA62DRAFT_233422 [Auriculariales sp. MPI-PUGE-AT-0066]
MLHRPAFLAHLGPCTPLAFPIHVSPPRAKPLHPCSGLASSPPQAKSPFQKTRISDLALQCSDRTRARASLRPGPHISCSSSHNRVNMLFITLTLTLSLTHTHTLTHTLSQVSPPCIIFPLPHRPVSLLYKYVPFSAAQKHATFSIGSILSRVSEKGKGRVVRPGVVCEQWCVSSLTVTGPCRSCGAGYALPVDIDIRLRLGQRSLNLTYDYIFSFEVRDGESYCPFIIVVIVS